jgi:hypothetical protein
MESAGTERAKGIRKRPAAGADACRKQGIMFGVYYSILDFYQYDYVGGTEAGSTLNRGGPGFKLDCKADFERYVSYML